MHAYVIVLVAPGDVDPPVVSHEVAVTIVVSSIAEVEVDATVTEEDEVEVSVVDTDEVEDPIVEVDSALVVLASNNDADCSAIVAVTNMTITVRR